jgi:hypothetical protein
LIFGLLFFYFFQEKFIFLNGNRLERTYDYQFANHLVNLFLKTDDGNELNAFTFKLSNPKGVILFCHGNKGNLSGWGKRVAYFLEYNFEVLVFD